jgi:hypothetical protein
MPTSNLGKKSLDWGDKNSQRLAVHEKCPLQESNPGPPADPVFTAGKWDQATTTLSGHFLYLYEDTVILNGTGLHVKSMNKWEELSQVSDLQQTIARLHNAYTFHSAINAYTPPYLQTPPSNNYL